MDPRMVMAKTYRILQAAKIDPADFDKELNNCRDADDAINICYKWQAIAAAA